MRRKRILAIAVSFGMALSVTACVNKKEENKTEQEQERNTVEAETTKADRDRKILIAYFSAGENSDVDVASSASVTITDGEAKGRLRVIADMIGNETGGDIFSIRTAVEYPGDGGELIDYAAKEQEEDVRPELTTHIENLEAYDTIFVGYPKMEQGLCCV